MNNLFIFENYHEVKFNYKNFINNQSQINKRFPNPLRDSGKYINVFDNMAGQILEEIYELNQEIRKNDWVGEETEYLLEELADVIMYCGSLFCETANYFNIDIEDFFFKNPDYSEIKILYNPNEKTMHFNLLNGEFIAVIRRYIYNRKYHKTASKKPTDYKEELLRKIIVYPFVKNNDFKNIYCFLNNYFFYRRTDCLKTSERVSLLENIILNKENKIVNL